MVYTTQYEAWLGPAGSSRGNLFIYGSYESVKAAQSVIFEAEELSQENKRLRESLKNLEEGLLHRDVRDVEINDELERLRSLVNLFVWS